MARRVIPVNDWAAVQEAIYDEASTSAAQQHPHPEPSSGSRNEHRFRSMSLSLPWRRPKSLLLNIDEDLSAKLPDLSLERSRSHISSYGAYGHGQSQTAGTAAGIAKAEATGSGSIRGIIRRASVSLKGMANKRKSATNHDAIFEERSLTLRPGTSHSTWHRLREVASFRHSKSSYGGDSSSLVPPQFDRAFPPMPMPGNGSEPPIIPRNTGAAAKAAAAAQNEYMGLARQSSNRAGLPNKWLLASDYDEYGNDHESGIGITVSNADSEIDLAVGDSTSEVEDAGISRIDFISKLPVELAIHILAHLDASALATVNSVSRSWQKIANNQHIWRESFLREKTTTYATSAPVQPGVGMGIPTVRPDNDWRQIYRVKEELDRRWKEGKARPVYLNGHLDSIYCLQFDESKIITGSRDKTIRIWDMHTFQCRLVIGPPEVVNDVSLLIDEETGLPIHYASLPDNPRASPSMPALVSFPTHHKASILCLQYDEKILVTGSSDSSCIVYNVRSGYRPIRRLQHHTAAVLDLAFDDKHIVTCSKDVSICVWDRASGHLLRQLRGHSGPVNAVQMRGNTIVSCSGDFRVKLWNIDTGKNIREFQGHTKGLACSQFSEDGRYVASAGNDKVIRIWDANTGECLQKMTAHDNLVRSLHIDSISGRLISGSYDTDIKVFDMATGNQLLDFPRWHASWVLSAKSDYRRIVSTGQDPKILIMDFGAGVKGIETLESGPGHEARVEGGYI